MQGIIFAARNDMRAFFAAVLYTGDYFGKWNICAAVVYVHIEMNQKTR